MAEMTAAEFAIFRALKDVGLDIACTEEAEAAVAQAKAQGWVPSFRIGHAREDGSIDISCRDAKMYPKLIGALASAMEELREYGITAPSVRIAFEKAAA